MTTNDATTTARAYCDGCTGRPSVNTYIVDHAVWTEYTEATVSLCATCEAEFYPAGGLTLTTGEM